MSSHKIPKQLQITVLNQPPNRSFLEQPGMKTPLYSSTKHVGSRVETKPDA